MSKVTVFVGLDYHKSAVQLCALKRDGGVLLNTRCANDWREITERVAAVGDAQAQAERTIDQRVVAAEIARHRVDKASAAEDRS